MNFFAIIGNDAFAEEELALCEITNINKHNKYLRTFDTAHPENLQNCSTLIKRGTVSDFFGLEEKINSFKMIGVPNKETGTRLKKEGRISRYKIIAPEHSDKEIKEKGCEVMDIDKRNNLRGVVTGRQNIALYEDVDFGKPLRGMQIGMMPAKLTHFLINLGVIYHNKQNKAKELSIWDPFVGFGTTSFLANYFGHHCIGSDINITQYKKNRQRREKSSWYQDKKHISFKHDILDPLRKPFLHNTDIIVTEGRLGPVIKRFITPQQAQENQNKIRKIYNGLLRNVHAFFNKPITLICTIPYYTDHDISIAPQVQEFCKQHQREIKIIATLYQRKKQSVARQICIIQTK